MKTYTKLLWLGCAVLFCCIAIYFYTQLFIKKPDTSLPVAAVEEEIGASEFSLLGTHTHTHTQRHHSCKDGKLFFSKGYGYADRARKVPMSPE